MPNVFAVYYKGRPLKETSPNRLLLTPKKSLTMKQYRSSTNNSDGILSVSFSVQAPFGLRSSSVRAPFNLRSSSVQAPFGLRSSSVHPPFELRSGSVQAPFILRSSSVQAPFILRSGIEDWSKINRRTNGESSEAKRRCIETLMGSQGKGNPNKNFIFNHLDSNYYGKIFRILNTLPNGMKLAREILILLK